MTIENRIISFLKNHEKEMFSLLDEIVSIQSGTWNKKGVDKVHTRIRSVLEPYGFSFEISRQEKFGDHLLARSPFFSDSAKQILLTGHMDTVFPEDTDFNFYKEDDKKSFGPGVIDMKGGLVVGIYSLLALHDAGILKDKPVTFIFNSDEEVGSRTSRQLILDEAKKSRAAFVFEAGGLNNEIVTGRKGNLSARLTIEGEAGHAAFALKNKASAILELGLKIIEIEMLNDLKSGISANVGEIKGGIGPNTIAQNAEARMDFRFLTTDDCTKLEKKIKKIAARTSTKGTFAKLEIVTKRSPMPQTDENMELFTKMRTIADSLGQKIIPELRFGVSDANIIAQAGIPLLDGLGPSGAMDHSENEYMERASLLERSILFGCFLARL